MAQLPGQPRTTVQGPINSVPCPHCGKGNDLREMQAQTLLDTGHKFLCDHCNRSMEVLSIRTVTVVTVRRSAAPAGARPSPQQPQPAQGGLVAGMKRLLGGPKR